MDYYKAKRRRGAYKAFRVLFLIFGILLTLGGGITVYNVYRQFIKDPDLFNQTELNIISAGVSGMAFVVGIIMFILSFALFMRKQFKMERIMGIR
ncbi:MAG: hypothetical protein IJQ67_06530 [Bacilli bacterium]|nr:hypothetical protein [Bacilli bacterium]